MIKKINQAASILGLVLCAVLACLLESRAV